MAPITADKPAQLIEKSMASPSVLAMLLTTKYVDGLPLHRFEKVMGRHGVDIPRQTLARWVIQCGEHLQPLLNLMRDQLLESRVIHCDETRVQVLKEQDREPSSQSCGKQFGCSRDFAASIGLVPRQYSTGGWSNLKGISKRGDKSLRCLLVQCARVYMQRLDSQKGPLADWVRSLLQRRHSNVVACARCHGGLTLLLLQYHEAPLGLR